MQEFEEAMTMYISLIKEYRSKILEVTNRIVRDELRRRHESNKGYDGLPLSEIRYADIDVIYDVNTLLICVHWEEYGRPDGYRRGIIRFDYRCLFDEQFAGQIIAS